jgi:NAD(P)-dependent dehydrogenase (short-subunit alcohol dehydrogenase family)
MEPAAAREGLGLFDLSGRVAVVTGSGRGLGKAIANALASAGASVYLVARTLSEIEASAADIRRRYGRAVPLAVDLTHPDSPRAMVEGCLREFGRLDVLVNNAGSTVRKPALETEIEDLDRILDLNVRSLWSCARAAAPSLMDSGSGRIINISSVLGALALPNLAAYAASKGAVDQLTRALALEWCASGVNVNAIAPGYFETELSRPVLQDPVRGDFVKRRTPMGRWGQPQELAGAAIFLASEASSYVNGQVICVDGGWTAC